MHETAAVDEQNELGRKKMRLSRCRRGEVRSNVASCRIVFPAGEGGVFFHHRPPVVAFIERNVGGAGVVSCAPVNQHDV